MNGYLAIDHQGNAYVTYGHYLGPKLFALDLTNGGVVEIGYLPLGPGYFSDLAFASSGELWGFFWDAQAPYTQQGLYRIDPSTAAETPVRLSPSVVYVGLAFAPAPSIAAYCTAKVNSAGCTPSIAGSGWPSQTATSGFEITASLARNGASGLLVYAASGRAALPFHGGYWCLAGSPRRTPIQSSGGNPPSFVDCSGTWTLDFNQWLYAMPAIPAGVTLNAQWYGRDPGFAPPDNVQLSNALELALEP